MANAVKRECAKRRLCLRRSKSSWGKWWWYVSPSGPGMEYFIVASGKTLNDVAKAMRIAAPAQPAKTNT
jgi:hypothetical protein